MALLKQIREGTILRPRKQTDLDLPALLNQQIDQIPLFVIWRGFVQNLQSMRDWWFLVLPALGWVGYRALREERVQAKHERLEAAETAAAEAAAAAQAAVEAVAAAEAEAKARAEAATRAAETAERVRAHVLPLDGED